MKILLVAFCCFFVRSLAYQYETKYIKQKIDHFSYVNNMTYLERYLINQSSWVKGGPIFLYAGNEGDVVSFANNTGIMWYWAPEFHAMLVFAEHRFYGESLPYGNASFESPSHLGYLTTEQTLADFAVLVDYLKQSIDGAQDSPVIVFGGSYGGMLAAWFRMKYPHIVDGALASSAPLLNTSCNYFPQLTTKAFEAESDECVKVIRKSWGIITKLNETESGRSFLAKTFNLCEPLSNKSTVDDLKNYISETWGNLAMTNYPYNTSFIMPLPAYPIRETCKKMTNSSKSDEDLLVDVFHGLSVFQNFTGQTTCFNTSNADGPDLSIQGWDFQCCTELVMPYCSDNVNDMFELQKWDFKNYTRDCQQSWNVTPEMNKISLMYGTDRIIASSNIIFSNGLIDPWSGGGIMESLSDSLIAIPIANAAHHLDLRYPDPADPVSVIDARNQEKQIITKWIKEANIHSSGGFPPRFFFSGWTFTLAVLGYVLIHLTSTTTMFFT